MKTKAIAACAAIAMALALAGCSGAPATSNQDANTSNSGASTVAAEQQPAVSERGNEIAKVGQTISGENFELTIDGWSWQEVVDGKWALTSTYGVSGITGKLLSLDTTITNTGTTEMKLSNLQAKAMGYVNGKYEYKGYFYLMKDNYQSLEPMETQTCRIVLNIPDEMADQLESATYVFGINPTKSDSKMESVSELQKAYEVTIP